MGLSMIRIPVDPRALRTYATLTRTGDGDGCYALHHAMRKRWGEVAPQPFHAVLSGPEPHVVGYMTDPERMRVVNDDPRIAAVFPGEIETRTMPLPTEAGAVLSFRLRARPLVRYGKAVADMIEKETGRRPHSEMCAVEAARLRSDGDVDPVGVCRDWLGRRMEGIASIRTFTLHDHVPQPVLRSTHGPAGLKQFPGSTAIMTGTLEVHDAEAFASLLAKGVGRHAAFGYGMMVVAPAPAALRAAA